MSDAKCARCAELEGQLAQAKVQYQKLIQATEEEEDEIVNRLMTRLQELRKEKERLLVQVEEEEEFLTNNLQKKLEEMKQEKIDLENEMEQEEEFLTNRLQKQLNELQTQAKSLEATVESQKEEIEKLTQQNQSFKQQNSELRGKVQKLNTENFVLNQRMESNRELLEEYKQESARLETDIEKNSEREFNTKKRSGGGGKRSRSISMPVGGQKVVAAKPKSPIRRGPTLTVPTITAEAPATTSATATTPIAISPRRRDPGPSTSPLGSPLSPIHSSPLGSSPISGFLTQPQYHSGFGNSTSVKRGWMRKENEEGHWATCMFVLSDNGELMCCDSESGVTIRINLDTVTSVADVSLQASERGSMPPNTMQVTTSGSVYRFACAKRTDFEEWFELVKDLSPLCK
eukprot:CAMPEP_0114607868 /NCGR_PEP_ID=MMETSP0168-20121206/2286_1 /TAXON_ID=95228 ORGANISM="Vannella sp., Strain DIVA3 517/6/12" /NCGR_SAMPLE_ID=MMETSP0168 /ASSEMBLY_ACC=CAM_ASM_000044 /LENGTH=401 /DNA_ID=CAMNT_0001818751 /DNA_START=48 /DNA_END=1253 /DNA_ORIENTATION=-